MRKDGLPSPKAVGWVRLARRFCKSPGEWNTAPPSRRAAYFEMPRSLARMNATK